MVFLKTIDYWEAKAISRLSSDCSRKQCRSDFNEITAWHNVLELEPRFNLRLNTAKKYQLYQKMSQIKVVEN